MPEVLTVFVPMNKLRRKCGCMSVYMWHQMPRHYVKYVSVAVAFNVENVHLINGCIIVPPPGGALSDDAV